MNGKNSTARRAGLLYLIVVIFGTLYLQLIPSWIRAAQAGMSYAENIINSPVLFKSGIAAEIICWVCFLMLPLTFYRLLQAVNDRMARLMVAFAAVQIPIAFANLSSKLDVLTSIKNAAILPAGQAGQLAEQVKWSLAQYQNGNHLNQIFWGLWLLPLGLLVIRSGFLPKFLGYLLIAGCFAYLIDFFASLFSKAYTDSVLSGYITLPAGIGEIGICLWLLIAGAQYIKITNHPIKQNSCQTIRISASTLRSNWRHCGHHLCSAISTAISSRSFCREGSKD